MDVERLRSVLSALPIAARGAVARFEVRVGLDSTGDPGVWVYVVVRDERVADLWPSWDVLRGDIREAVERVAGPDVVTYVRMWAESEVEDVHASP